MSPVRSSSWILAARPSARRRGLLRPPRSTARVPRAHLATLAALFLKLRAEFLAAAQVIVYAGPLPFSSSSPLVLIPARETAPTPTLAAAACRWRSPLCSCGYAALSPFTSRPAWRCPAAWPRSPGLSRLPVPRRVRRCCCSSPSSAEGLAKRRPPEWPHLDYVACPPPSSSSGFLAVARDRSCYSCRSRSCSRRQPRPRRLRHATALGRASLVFFVLCVTAA